MVPQLPSAEEVRLVMPEIWLVIAMCVVIMVPFIKRTSLALPVVSAIVGLSLAVLFVLPLQEMTGAGGRFVFGQMLAIDPFSQFFKLLLFIFTILIIVQWLLTSRHHTLAADVPDYLCLLLGATVGMAAMASASNLLTMFMAMETASLPSFALAGFRKQHRRSTEGALKYVLFGAAASAIGVYGMSLIYGATGTLSLAGIAMEAAKPNGFTPLLGVGLMAMFAGLAFKLSAVPMHFWCPDVFEGAPVEVTTFLSVASKGAAICLLVRVLQTFCDYGGVGPNADRFIGLSVAVAILGCVTATWGNLVAFHQNNIKRLLAYSSIAHAGYMIMGASLIAVVPVGDPGRILVGALLFYVLVYMFMNLGAFTVAALVAQEIGSEDISDYANLARRSPLLMVFLTIFLLSLFGMPGLGGFMAKIFLGLAMVELGHPAAFALIAVLLINTLLSLYYYVRPVYFMAFVGEEENRPVFAPRLAGLAMLLICAIPLVWTGLLPQGPSRLARTYATLVLRPPTLVSAGIQDPQSQASAPSSAPPPLRSSNFDP